jgi:uncharacterized protein YxjI
MAKYYINQKFSLRDRFAVLDENLDDIFLAEGTFFSLGKQIRLTTLDGQELLYIKEKIWTFLAQFEFYIGNQLVCEMKQDFAFFRKKYTVITPQWTIEGDVWSFNYEIREGSELIATIRKEWFSFMDAYEIDVFVEEYTELVLGMVIAIDADLSDDGD